MELKLTLTSTLRPLVEVHKGARLLHASPTHKWTSIVKEQQEVCEPANYFYTQMCLRQGYCFGGVSVWSFPSDY